MKPSRKNLMALCVMAGLATLFAFGDLSASPDVRRVATDPVEPVLDRAGASEVGVASASIPNRHGLPADPQVVATCRASDGSVLSGVTLGLFETSAAERPAPPSRLQLRRSDDRGECRWDIRPGAVYRVVTAQRTRARYRPGAESERIPASGLLSIPHGGQVGVVLVDVEIPGIVLRARLPECSSVSGGGVLYALDLPEQRGRTLASGVRYRSFAAKRATRAEGHELLFEGLEPGRYVLRTQQTSATGDISLDARFVHLRASDVVVDLGLMGEKRGDPFRLRLESDPVIEGIVCETFLDSSTRVDQMADFGRQLHSPVDLVVNKDYRVWIGDNAVLGVSVHRVRDVLGRPIALTEAYPDYYLENREQPRSIRLPLRPLSLTELSIEIPELDGVSVQKARVVLDARPGRSQRLSWDAEARTLSGQVLEPEGSRPWFVEVESPTRRFTGVFRGPASELSEKLDLRPSEPITACVGDGCPRGSRVRYAPSGIGFPIASAEVGAGGALILDSTVHGRGIDLWDLPEGVSVTSAAEITVHR